MDYQFFKNQKQKYENKYGLVNNFDDVFRYHQNLKEYQLTPLYALNDMALKYQIKNIYVKDESYRFNLNAFKGLGVSYATRNINDKNAVLVACTDGNHGKALAWIGMINNYDVIIFMPEGTLKQRVAAIEKYQAKVIVTSMNYDNTVRYASKYAQDNGYYLIQDTIVDDNIDSLKDIMLGYSTLINEVYHQMENPPTHVFVQAGVGSLAGGIIWYLINHIKPLPYIGVIESSSCPCIYDSIKSNKYCSIGGSPKTIMAGLNCGEANVIALDLIKAYATWLIKCDDIITIQGMDRAKNPIGHDLSFSSGESGAVGLGLVEEILKHQRDEFNIDENSVILVINSEGELENVG